MWAWRLGVGVGLLWLGAQGSTAQFLERAKLTAPDGAAFDQLGASVAVSGDTVLVGANRDDVGANADQGSVYVFVRVGSEWRYQAKLTASDGGAGDFFGHSVALSGDTALVGAPLDDTGAQIDHGSAYVFVRSGGIWTQQAKLTASDAAAADMFGFAVSLSGGTALVGAKGDNAEQGSAYVYVVSGTTWTQQAKLTATDGAAGDMLGYSVALNGDTALLGAPVDAIGANLQQGSAYVFVRSGTTWSQQAKLTALDGAPGDQLGFAVALSGETAAVGANLDDEGGNPDQGSVYVFVRGGTSWSQQSKLTASDGAAVDVFGSAVALSGEIAVMGAHRDDVGANSDQGSAYVFVRSGTLWNQQQKLAASDGAGSDLFGYSVSLSAETVLVGAYPDDISTNFDQGSASVFEYSRPLVNLIPAGLSFGNQLLGASTAPQTVTLSNTGTAPLIVSSVTLAGSHPGDFQKSADACTGATIAPGGSCAVSVIFAPTAFGERSASLTISDNAADSPQNAALSGAGVSTITTVTSSPNPSSYGQNVTFIAQVLGSGAVPTGSVTFRDGTATLGIVALPASGSAVYATSQLPIGSHAITATYNGDALHAPSVSAVLGHRVNPYASATYAYTSLNPAPAGRTVTVLATVAGDSPSGTVTFLEGANTLGVASVGALGYAAIALANLSQGTHQITAVYSGDSRNLGSTSAPVSLLITAPAPICSVAFANPVNLAAAGGPFHVAAADLNQDGRTDLVVTAINGNAVGVHLAAAGGGFHPAVAYPVGSGPRATGVGDFDGNGIADLVSAGYSTMSVLLGSGGGSFASAVITPLSDPTAQWIAVADVNRDGRLDVVVDASPNVAVRLGNGNGTFQPPLRYATGATQVAGLAVADFNGDGKLDIAAGDVMGTTIQVLFGDGLGGLANGFGYAAGSGAGVGVGPRGLAPGDFNGDGRPDLAIVNAYNVAIVLGTGNAHPNAFGAPTTYTVGSGPYSAAVGDFTGDGAADLVVANQAGNSISFLRGNGNGTFQAASHYSAGLQPIVPAAADLNGDGKLDLAVANLISNDVSLLTGIATTGATSVALAASPSPSVFGGVVTLTATVTAAGACGPLSGMVSFEDGGVQLGAASAAGGQASLTVSGLATGQHMLRAVYPGDSNYSGSASATVAHTVDRAGQTIVFGPLPAKTFGDAPFSISAAGGASGQPVTFEAAGNCTVSGGTVTITGAGSCSITARQSGDANYLAAPEVTQSFSIAKALATLTLGSLSQIYDGAPKPASVLTTPSGLSGVAVSYDGGLAAPVNAGSYTVIATLAHANYAASPVSGLLVIAAPTPTGSPTVSSAVGAVTVSSSFSSVTGAGVTTVTPITPLSAADTPGGFLVSGANLAFDVTTTASYSGNIVTCFVIPSVTTQAEFDTLRILHREFVNGVYQLLDVTITKGVNKPNFPARTLCAKTSSLSPFYLATVVDLTPPAVTDLALSLNPAPAGSATTLSAKVSDAVTKIASAEYSLDGGVNWQPIPASYYSSTTLNVSVQLTPPVGVYGVCLRGVDAAQNEAVACGLLLAVYDSAAGFVTGGGWIESPTGAWVADPQLTGKASFAFIAKYLRGANVPTGDTQFQFQVARLNFKSAEYEWLVIAGARAQFKGSGTVNGTGNYGFLLTAIDGQVSGGGGLDRFRIKIWDKSSGALVYDNQPGASDAGNASTELGGGAIIIHAP